MLKGILMSTEMVRAILAGRKTVTRRLIKLAPADEYHFIELETDPDEIRIQPGSGEEYPYKLSGLYAVFTGEFGYPMVKAPYQSGDVLYVRETWCKGSLNGGAEQYFYRADENEFYCSWHPSIHMPKEAARIFLRVTEVKVERLQEITVEGTLQEGIDTEVPPICESSINGNIPNDNQREYMNKLSEKELEEYIQDLARHTYMGWCDYADKLFRIYNQLWNSTIKKSDIDKYGWNANPWVWVILFERISKEEVLSR